MKGKGAKPKKKDEAIVPLHEAQVPEELDGEFRAIQEGIYSVACRVQRAQKAVSTFPVRTGNL